SGPLIDNKDWKVDGSGDSVRLTVKAADTPGTAFDLSGLTFANWDSSDEVRVEGTIDDDDMTGTPVNDTILGYYGNDSLHGSGGDDSMNGHSGQDTLVGGLGNDSIKGSIDADMLLGGAGNDTFYFTAGAGDVAAGEQIDGGDGTDTLYVEGNDTTTDFRAAASIEGIEVVHLSQTMTKAWFSGPLIDNKDWKIDGSGDSVRLTVKAADTPGTTGTAFDLSGLTFANWDSSDEVYVYGTSNDDTMTGTSESDTMTGSVGADSLVGGEGNDLLQGDAGSDTLIGGPGTDTLIGGADQDHFTFSDATSIDTVTDFQVIGTSTGGARDILHFDEASLGFSADGDFDFWLASDTNSHESTLKKIIGVEDAAASDWSDAAQVMENTLSDFGDGSDDDTYFVLSNGTDGRIYYWDGDEDGGSDVDDSELLHLVDLDDLSTTDIGDLTEVNFQIASS
ncbi:MAG: hypothetical protein K9J81_06615, partial [Desulfohalobiaceae bacterium]|nr:hypothetical protein [Desulfohalobiaceae bacterium]